MVISAGAAYSGIEYGFILYGQRQRSPSAHKVRRKGGTPCWIPFSLAVPGFALRNRGRAVDALSIDGVEGPLNVR